MSGLILTRGDIVQNLTKDEGERVLKMTWHYYIKEPELPRMFNESPSTFDHESYIKKALNF